ncbi:MAG: hypothetical protein IJJ41_04260 [Clostridia bacterium]|nr:hypothetical protein [Clostridia bacterium]
MKVEIGENNSLLVFLTAQEVAALHLSLSNADYIARENREIIARIYRRAAARSGFLPGSYASRVIELLPFEDGSLLLCFRFARTRAKLKVRALKRSGASLYHFATPEAFGAFLAHASALQQLPEAVYESGGEYRLVVGKHAHRLAHMLGEFSERITAPLALPRTREYWREVYCKEA